jgi:glycerophosphoryl diester phosphodiesterase
MTWAFIRIAAISLFTILSLIAFALVVRMSGYSVGYAGPRHAFVDLNRPIVALGGDETVAPSNSLPALQAVEKLGHDFVIGVDIQQTFDGEWIVFRDDNLDHLTDLTGSIELKTWAELKNVDLGNKFEVDGTRPLARKNLRILKLNEILEAFPESLLFLNIHTRYPDKMAGLVKLLDPRQSEERFIVQSPFATALREIHKLRPRWLFGVDPSTVVRFLFMTSIYMETIADLHADLFVAPLLLDQKIVFSQRVLDEVARRKKLILIQNPPPFDKIPQQIQGELFGLITRHPQMFKGLNSH